MTAATDQPRGAATQAEASFSVAAPHVELPKGGGAIRGIGEKFATNPATGTGGMSVPIAASPGRSGFGPELSLSYDSGAGNGVFGFGWSLGTPQITRKTDKGLPRYDDAGESDVFVLSGAEDLVPVVIDGRRHTDSSSYAGYTIHHYRPRVEGSFARIERWTRDADGDTHWRSISGDNVLTLYGVTPDDRIADSGGSTRVFSWLVSEIRDDKGNAVIYTYKPDDDDGVDYAAPHESSRGARGDPRRSVNRYLKRIRYGNRISLLDPEYGRPPLLDDGWQDSADWMFELVFDYGDHDRLNPSPKASKPWSYRFDAVSSRRAAFEIRTTRRCERVLMFHHFVELGVPDGCLVRSTELHYADGEERSGIYSFLSSVTHSGWRRVDDGYVMHSMPPVEFKYSQPLIGREIKTADTSAGLPIGIDGAKYRIVDLDGYGASGVLTEQAENWYYSRNLSPLTPGKVVFAAPSPVRSKPNLALGLSGAQFVDLAGDGLLDLAVLNAPLSGFYEHDPATGWAPFRPIRHALNRNLNAANVKLIDITGDGHTDILIIDGNELVWHESLGEEGFGPENRVWQTLNADDGPRLVFTDATSSVYLADMTGDGLTDLVQIDNFGVCYWPSLGYGAFGPKIAMGCLRFDHPDRFGPKIVIGNLCFDHSDQFDPARLLLADIDGSGTNDVIYVGGDGVDLYFNASGNAFTTPTRLPVFPQVSSGTQVATMDLNGDGTACLVWSSSLPADAAAPLRYVELMADGKPHLMVRTVNNLGAETQVHYTSSTALALQAELDGKPWLTRVSFPVHVVDKVITRDHLSGNRFTTSYRYRDGYFDGEEREFRGFARVDQLDTEEIAVLTETGQVSPATNEVPAYNVPPVLTRMWFHTGAMPSGPRLSRVLKDEYFSHPALDGWLLDDTVLPTATGDQPLSDQEVREAVRSLKGSMLRTELYALDTPQATIDEPGLPYAVTEQNLETRCLQRRGPGRHAVFFTHPRESISHHVERDPDDPRTTHTLILDVDDYGNVLQEALVAYGRRSAPREPGMTSYDQELQWRIHVTVTDHRFTAPLVGSVSDYRMPQPAEVITYEIRKPVQEKMGDPGVVVPFPLDELRRRVNGAADGAHDIAYEDLGFARAVQAAQDAPAESGRDFRRVIEHVQTRYRRDDLTGLLPLGAVESRALPGESIKLAFTQGLLAQVFERGSEQLLPDAAYVLGHEGGYVADGAGSWWIPSGQTFFSPEDGAPAHELAFAADHFFLPHRYRNPFGHSTVVHFDDHDLSIVSSRDPLGNVVTVETMDDEGHSAIRFDYRVLKPYWVTDPNGNRTRVVFDTLGLVAGTATMGKPGDDEGDVIDAGFEVDLTQDQLDALYDAADPVGQAAELLGDASTRIVYDLFQFMRSAVAYPDDPQRWRPTYAATIAREMHAGENVLPHGERFQLGFSYSDGLGREIQQKVQAEPGPVVPGGSNASPRWVGSGWTVYNNKGKPVRQFEPFFSRSHHFDRDFQVGMSPTLFYDPVGRVIATLHPNHTWEKVQFGPWRQRTWDVNDTVLVNPALDPDLRGFVSNTDGSRRLPDDDYLPSWYDLRTDPAHAADFAQQYPDDEQRASETGAAEKATAHAGTAATAHLDALGRTMLTVAHNTVSCWGHEDDGTEAWFTTRIELDLENNERAVRDAITAAQNAQGNDVEDPLGRVVMRYAYDMLGNLIHQTSMDAGERWTLNDVTGAAIRSWDSRGHSFITEYDKLRRPVGKRVHGEGTQADPRTLGDSFLLVEKIEYGESQPDAEKLHLRGKVFRHNDSAGILTIAYDFKGNVLRTERRLVTGYRDIPDWAKDVGLADEIFPTASRYDALNRVIQSYVGHNVIQPVFNEANLLERIDIWLSMEAEPDEMLDATAVAPSAIGVRNIDYDAKGRRQAIEYRNSARTSYEYDPLTFRLTRLRTERPQAFPDDCPKPPVSGWPGCHLQDLHYTYDPAGNITRIRDTAQQRIFFKGRRVEPSNDYTYDALYRLVEGTGREHLGQGRPIPHSHDDAGRIGLVHPGDGAALGRYIERYTYDAVGNVRSMQHRVSDDAQPGWTRPYSYTEPSLLEDGTGGSLRKTSNRLSSTTVVGTTEPYLYDAHGNMTRMPHLGNGSPVPNMDWDYLDRLGHTAPGGGGDAYYVYDASGERVRKVWEKAPGRIDERIYIGGFEVYRRHHGPIDGNSAVLERATLQVMDDRQRIALVETRTLDNAGIDKAPQQLIRYQLGNHLGSSSIELDDAAKIVSYEEYTPYGSTSYQAVRSVTETPKRYRYTGKERDEESGFAYHGLRYYVSHLGRWSSPDPAGPRTGISAYAYVNCSPVLLIDPNGAEGAPPPTQSESSFWQQAVILASFSFTAATGQTPESFGKGMADKAYALTVGSAIAVYDAGAALYGTNGMLDKAAQKGVDRAMGIKKPDEAYVTVEEHHAQFDAIVTLGMALFPGIKGSFSTPQAAPQLATAAAGATGAPALAATRAVEVAIPEAAVRVGVVLNTAVGGGNKPTTSPTGSAEPTSDAAPTPDDVKPDVYTHQIMRSKTVGPAHGSKSRGYDRRSLVHQKVLKFGLKYYSAAGKQPTSIKDLDLGHQHDVPFSRIRPGQQSTLQAELAGPNRSIGSSVEKAERAEFLKRSNQLGVDPYDLANPGYVRPRQ